MQFNKLFPVSLICVALLTPTTVFSEDAPLTVNIKRLSMDTALRIAQAAIKECRKRGVQVAVTVVDRGGDPQVMLRDVLAMDITVAISRKKAHTALAFNSPLSAMTGRFKSPHSVAKIDELIVSPGGVPVNIGGSIMAGVGVSGAPDGKVDEACAVAGIAAVQDDLELGD